MSYDYHAHGISIDESGVEDEGYQVVIENDRVQVEVESNLTRGCKKWNEAVKWFFDGLLLFSLDLHNMQSAVRYPLASEEYLKYDI